MFATNSYSSEMCRRCLLILNLFLILCNGLDLVNRSCVDSADNSNSDIIGKDYLEELTVGSAKRCPDRFDWRNSGHVSPVKNQGLCDACWAFAIIGTVESHVKIHLGSSDNLSEQFLIDCLETSPGCYSMSLLRAYSDIWGTLGGVLTERSYYPFEEKQKRCRWDNNRVPLDVFVTGIQRVRPYDEDAMAEAIATNGPITAAINPVRMFKYHGNYIDEPTRADCNERNLTHSVTIVGYDYYKDEKTRVDYWIIKNSWGEEFGDNGYYYLVRGRNACGIASDVSYPVVAKN